MINRDEYVATLCRIGDHAGCQERPVVRCDCGCHTGTGVDRPTGEERPAEEHGQPVREAGWRAVEPVPGRRG